MTTSSGSVRIYNADEGWGVIDGPDVPGGCWVHFSVISMDGYRQLTPGQSVLFRAQRVAQDGFAYRATEVWTEGTEPADRRREVDGSGAYHSRLTLNRHQGGTLMTDHQTAAAGGGRPGTADADAETGQAVTTAWQVLGPLMDLVTPMALRVAATLRLADFMPDDGTGEGAVLADLAERAGADPEALARVLRHLVQHGVFTEPRPGHFAVNQTAALLRTGHPGAVWLDLEGFGGRMDLAFTGLAHTVRTGAPAWEQVFGQPFWAYLDANPAIGASFDTTMAVDAGNIPVAGGYDWTTVRHVADIGGGTGTLIAEVLRRNPWLRGTLVDLPETAARAGQYLAGLGLDGRYEVVGRSFFEPLPVGADAYLLNRVIHDWDDAEAGAILRRCREAAQGTGRVLVVESHGAGGGDAAAFAEMNLRMLVLTGGRERTIDDYSALAAGAGLRVTAVHDITERHVIIECVPG